MNTNQKVNLKIFIFLFLISFLIIKWSDVSWIFNYREVQGLVYDFFNPYQESDLLVSANTQGVAQKALVQTPKTLKKTYPYSDRNNSLEITVIGVDTPVIIAQSTNKKDLAENLDQGAVLYPGSVLPGEHGQIVILGHSAPPNWPHIKHDYIFSDIEHLNYGEEINFYFNHAKYAYQVIDKRIIKVGQDIDISALAQNNNMLTLISCWPRGKNSQRIAVTAKLVEI